MTALQQQLVGQSNSRQLRTWTVAEYHRLSEAGILNADERTELVEGQIFTMAAKGSPHTTALCLLAKQLRQAVGARALICT